jgi:hypothetical protein
MRPSWPLSRVSFPSRFVLLSYESPRLHSGLPNISKSCLQLGAGTHWRLPSIFRPRGLRPVWIGCERHSQTFSSLPQCKHAGHSVALGSSLTYIEAPLAV